MNSRHYIIRLNVQPCAPEVMWRIFEDGKELEQKAAHVDILVPSYTEMTVEDYPDRFGRYEKYNIACDGIAVWQGSRVSIMSAVMQPHGTDSQHLTTVDQ